jgi:hypothetical protein
MSLSTEVLAKKTTAMHALPTSDRCVGSKLLQENQQNLSALLRIGVVEKYQKSVTV